MMTSRSQMRQMFYVHALVAVCAAGCASAPETRAACAPPSPIALTVEATSRLNPDAEGRALPTELRIYQLRNASAFEMAAFVDIWSNAADVLGEALISEETLTLYPGDRLQRQIQPSGETQALVAVAIVREPRGRTWRAVVPMSRNAPSNESCPALEPSRLVLRLDDYRIEAITPRTNQEMRG
jgi:type VI secretion system protein VasD